MNVLENCFFCCLHIFYHLHLKYDDEMKFTFIIDNLGVTPLKDVVLHATKAMTMMKLLCSVKYLIHKVLET